MEILTLYKGILESLNGIIDANGRVSFRYGDDVFPCMINDRRLVLPTPELLRSGNWQGLVAFHPMSENATRGESVVLKHLKNNINLRIQSILGDLLFQLVRLAADHSKHAKIPPRAHELLSHLPEVDEKSVQAMERIVEAAEIEGSRRLISIYLKRSGVLRGTKYHRLAVVSFPILEEFKQDNEHTVFGVKLRKKDFLAFRGLFNYLLPGADDADDEYSAGSLSLVAPYFDSLVQAYAKVAKQLNVLVKAHGKQLANADELTTNLDWVDLARDLSVYRDVIPTLEGNDGEHVGQEEIVGAPITATARPVPAVVSGSHIRGTIGGTAVPIAPPSVADGKPTNGFNVEFVQQQRHQEEEQRQRQAAVAAPSGARVDAAGIKHTGRGLDFNSIQEAKQRQMAAAGYGVPQGMMPPGMMPGMVPANVAAGWNYPQAQPAPVGAGGYAGYHRGVPIQQQGYGMMPPGYPGGYPPPGMMGQQMPDWMTNPSTRTVIGGPTNVPPPGFNQAAMPFGPPYIHNTGYNPGL